MNNNGAILVIEDNEDDRFIMEEVLIDLNYPNNRVYFSGGKEAMDYLQNSESNPFIVFSDISLIKLSDLEVKRELRADRVFLSRRIPFILLSDTSNTNIAYDRSPQGSFIKTCSISEFTKTINTVIEYWQRCSPQN
ncbi:hypothetical protein [Dyadobacter sp. CY323]|uniref:hypothetical protein n=1 Tax=Dyadobacter sp. CY323 TaxID=2907302 RepID=UPI001F3454DD|nr:hypothetical protein [Dyadobacter sp. CY323]MCE6989850.1 hypothetical protein [Dyadobacter sp. CY323]